MDCIANEYLKNIGKYRTALMGFSMICVFLYHARSERLGFMPTGFIGSFINYGFLGVDIFLFLSAYGLCYSLKKNSIRVFFRNRFKRIIPTWWIVLLSVQIIGIFIGHLFPGDNFVYPHSILDMFYWYTGLGFFFKECCYEWYIPTLLLFYLLIPVIFNFSRKTILIMILVTIPLIVYYDNSGVLPYLAISITRIPVFLTGILFFLDSERNSLTSFMFTCVFFFIYTFLISFFMDVRITIFMCSLTPILCCLISFLLSLKYSNIVSTFLTFVGTVSLEFYLIHLYKRPQFLLSYYIKDNVIQVIGAFALCLLLSYILHILSNRISSRFDSFLAILMSGPTTRK